MLDNKNIGERIRAAIKLAGINQSKLAQLAGVSAQAVGQWIKNSRVDKKHLPVVARATGVRLLWLLSGEGPMLDPAAHRPDQAYRVDEDGPVGYVPVLDWSQVDHQEQGFDLNHNLSDVAAGRWVICHEPHNAGTFALKVTGRSMTAPSGLSVPEGYFIVVDPNQAKDVDTGDLVLAFSENKVTFKQMAEEDGQIYLRPLNPQHPPLFSDFAIIGKIIQVTLDLQS